MMPNQQHYLHMTIYISMLAFPAQQYLTITFNRDVHVYLGLAPSSRNCICGILELYMTSFAFYWLPCCLSHSSLYRSGSWA